MCVNLIGISQLKNLLKRFEFEFEQIRVPFISFFFAFRWRCVLSLFIYCYFGKMASRSFEKMCQLVSNSDWHTLPVNLQKYFILIIANMQQPLVYRGFASIHLDLETFIFVSSALCSIISEKCAVLENLGVFHWKFAIFQLVRRIITFFMMFRTMRSDFGN